MILLNLVSQKASSFQSFLARGWARSRETLGQPCTGLWGAGGACVFPVTPRRGSCSRGFPGSVPFWCLWFSHVRAPKSRPGSLLGMQVAWSGGPETGSSELVMLGVPEKHGCPGVCVCLCVWGGGGFHRCLGIEPRASACHVAVPQPVEMPLFIYALLLKGTPPVSGPPVTLAHRQGNRRSRPARPAAPPPAPPGPARKSGARRWEGSPTPPAFPRAGWTCVLSRRWGWGAPAGIR